MTDSSAEGYLVVSRDVDSAHDDPFKLVDVYSLMEPASEFLERIANAPRTPKTRVLEDDFARAAAETLRAEREHLRPDTRRGCDCSGRGRQTSLVIVYAKSDGSRWLWQKGYRIPNEAKGSTAHLHEADKAWPLGASGASVTYCQHCGRYWAVLRDGTAFRMVKVAHRHGVMVQP